uniref:GS catalytic domain-containing protein n=1 Tax=Glossina palpalis gambiensis TaxID=67801 RepID=A0A1B0C3Q9_9MUSC
MTLMRMFESSIGVKTTDDLLISRYILLHIYEEFNIVVAFEGPWNGAGAHTNFSIKAMPDGDMKPIERSIRKLSKHRDHHKKSL